MLAGKPLIAYSIQTALNSCYIDDTLVSTEDEEIAEIARIYGADVVHRPIDLAGDKVPLDPVIFHALTNVEKEIGTTYDYVITLQPTSPLLQRETLDRAIIEFIESGCDTLITVKDETHLYWTKKGEKYLHLYDERKNRQFLDPIYKETGALFISRRDIITKISRIGSDIYLFEVPSKESIDIDTYHDWWVAENLLNQLRVVLRVDGDIDIGLGHVYRAITLVSRMFNQDVCFFMDESKKLGIEKVREQHYPIITFQNEENLFEKLKLIKPHIIINDILDTSEEYMIKLKNKHLFVVNFEDLGSGSNLADVLINALYERSAPPKNSYYGDRYVCLRDEFYIFPPKKVNKKVKNILILFGGSDPNNLTLKALKAMEKLGYKDIKITVVVGLGYSYIDELSTYIKSLRIIGFDIDLKQNVKTMAKIIGQANIAITSNGRTIYEVAVMGVPCISISQNEREVRHLFSHTCRGIVNLGIESNVDTRRITLTLRTLIEDYALRKKMSDVLRSFELKKGTDRVLRMIFDNYWEATN